MLLIAAASAHPGSSSSSVGAARDVIGHRIELTIADTVTLHYVAEVPERRVLADARTEQDYGKKLLVSLGDNLELTWNGTALPMTPDVVTEAVTPADGGFLNFALQWHATLPSATGTLGLRNGNYPSEPGFFATSVLLDGGLVAVGSSLLKVKNGRVRDNWHGAWVRDEASREPWVEVRPATFVERSTSPGALPLRMAGLERDSARWWVWPVGAVGLVALATLGRWMGRRARGHR